MEERARLSEGEVGRGRSEEEEDEMDETDEEEDERRANDVRRTGTKMAAGFVAAYDGIAIAASTQPACGFRGLHGLHCWKATAGVCQLQLQLQLEIRTPAPAEAFP